MGKVGEAVNIADLRAMARARLPRVVFDYLDGGAEDECTLRDNVRAFRRWNFRPRHGVKLPALDLSATVMGQTLAWPAMTAPIGYSGLMHRDGEKGAGRAAARAGIASVLSTISGARLEDMAATGVPLFMQIYLLGGRAAGEATIARAQGAGVKGLFLTIDTPVGGLRERDVRNGLAQLLGRDLVAKARYLPDILAHPGWVADYLLGARMSHLPNVVIPGQGPLPLIDVASALQRSVVRWDDLPWIRAQWKGPIAIKGVLTGEDARRAIDGGADAVVVSNHGGRQLDGVAAGLDALPEVVAAAGGQCEVLMDGGIRRGGDIVKALALGARAVLLGRASAYGLAAGGEQGVDRALAILQADLTRTMMLLGCASVAQLGATHLERR
ncbi:MAG: alpha-hydroxy-acid oxidizing protein [Alphaproteobacteria bacterium]|nr:alpha-hydroxy-acid oxidizing protein [Alphaproteobacteria bacterium]